MNSQSVDSQEDHYLIALRHDLHRIAEPSAKEGRTAARLIQELRPLQADCVLEGLGGQGVGATFEGTEPGPTVLFRADMDALPIDETIPMEHASLTPGVAHKCGHDGHMTIALGVARRFSRCRPTRGRLAVLFQPSEENGMGAARVLKDAAFASIRPDIALALHNLPGFELGQVVLRSGPFACASRGLTINLLGATSHAAEPQLGKSPALALAQVILAWTGARQLFTGLEESAQATVIHAVLGSLAFGTSPGDGGGALRRPRAARQRPPRPARFRSAG
jgi:amidohydrolase